MSTSLAAQTITTSEARQAGASYVAPIGLKAIVDQFADICGQNAGDIRSVWAERNAAQLAENEAMLKIFVARMTAQFGKKAASDFQIQLHQQVDQQLADQRNAGFPDLTSAAPEKLAAFCRQKLAPEVRAGKWDVKAKDPDAAKYLDEHSK